MDLLSKFGVTLFKGDLARAEQDIARKEASSGGEDILTDLVSEDKVLQNRA